MFLTRYTRSSTADFCVLIKHLQSWLPAKAVVEATWDKRMEVHSSGTDRVAVFETESLTFFADRNYFAFGRVLCLERPLVGIRTREG